jgi:hypothetical protein
VSAKSLVLLLAALMFALFAVSSASSAASPGAGAGAGAERLPARCSAEWDLAQGWTQLDVRVYDTPSYLASPSGFNPFATITGAAVFTAGGRFVVTCAGNADLPLGGSPWRAAGFPCRIYRGRRDYSLSGARLYTGRGRLLVTRDGRVEIGCLGSFDRIVSSPAD